MLFASALILFMLLTPGATASSILQTLAVPGSEPYRILSGVQANEYWIVVHGVGLVLLYQNGQGAWALSSPYGDHLYDATGPDSNGRIFCSAFNETDGSYVWVFDCSQRAIISRITLGADYPLAGLCLSPDESSLFVLGDDWPRLGQPGGSFIESLGHPDAGIVWQIDTATGVIVDRGACAALPETIYYAQCETGPDKLFISSETTAADSSTAVSALDVLNVERGFPRQTVIWTQASLMPYCIDVLNWSATEPLIAAMCPADNYDSNPDGHYAIWIIDPTSGSVVSRLQLTWNGIVCGLNHACLSQASPCNMYASIFLTGHCPIAVIDRDTGALVNTIPVGDVDAQFIYEMPNDNLIVTTGKDGKILIIDPT
jgi:hypothetical protein